MRFTTRQLLLLFLIIAVVLTILNHSDPLWQRMSERRFRIQGDEIHRRMLQDLETASKKPRPAAPPSPGRGEGRPTSSGKVKAKR